MNKDKPKLLSKVERLARIRRANEFIEVIASCGRQYFRHEDRVAKFYLGDQGQLSFQDAYSQKLIYVSRDHDWSGFSHGGTLRALIRNLSLYIRFGQPIWMGYFEPMRDGSCYWSYGHEAMARVRDAAGRLLTEETTWTTP